MPEPVLAALILLRTIPGLFRAVCLSREGQHCKEPNGGEARTPVPRSIIACADLQIVRLRCNIEGTTHKTQADTCYELLALAFDVELFEKKLKTPCIVHCAATSLGACAPAVKVGNRKTASKRFPVCLQGECVLEVHMCLPLPFRAKRL